MLVTDGGQAMIVPAKRRSIQLPDSDGQPMADNTLQFEWIATLKGGCDALFADRDDVFVAGDHLIYPVEPPEPPEGEEIDVENVVRLAPDVYVAFGRPKGHRGSYKVWEENGIFPQVVFEVWSPSNRLQQMEDKRKAYEEYGAEEYYIVYPEFPSFVEGWVRKEGKFARVADIKTWTSPRLGIRFRLRKGQLSAIRPDGTPFLTYLELNEKWKAEQRRAEQEAKRAESAEQKAARLAAKLRELGLDPDVT
jgi:Uma2 family endonuclease